jgi:hypothetical protein
MKHLVLAAVMAALPIAAPAFAGSRQAQINDLTGMWMPACSSIQPLTPAEIAECQRLRRDAAEVLDTVKSIIDPPVRVMRGTPSR